MKNLTEAWHFMKSERNRESDSQAKTRKFDSLDLYEKMRLADKYRYKGAYYFLNEWDKIRIMDKLSENNL